MFTQALTGEPFEYRGTTMQVTPGPLQRPRPPVLLGGAVPSAPLRAARLADGYMPPIPDPALYDAYLAERERLGKPPGELVKPSGPLFVHVADDPDRAWAAIAPHALHEANEYAKWAALVPGSNPWVPDGRRRPAPRPGDLRGRHARRVRRARGRASKRVRS